MCCGNKEERQREEEERREKRREVETKERERAPTEHTDTHGLAGLYKCKAKMQSKKANHSATNTEPRLTTKPVRHCRRTGDVPQQQLSLPLSRSVHSTFHQSIHPSIVLLIPPPPPSSASPILSCPLLRPPQPLSRFPKFSRSLQSAFLSGFPVAMALTSDSAPYFASVASPRPGNRPSSPSSGSSTAPTTWLKSRAPSPIGDQQCPRSILRRHQ